MTLPSRRCLPAVHQLGRNQERRGFALSRANFDICVSITFASYPTYFPIDYSIHAFLALRCILCGLDMVTSRGLVTYQVGNIPNQTIYSGLILLEWAYEKKKLTTTMVATHIRLDRRCPRRCPGYGGCKRQWVSSIARDSK